jgi:SAM-dependent methyltransferase
MGINRDTAEFLCEARAAGAPFGRVLTLGRQNLNFDREALRLLAARHGVMSADDALGAYCEPFFARFLGAQEVEAIDNSGYEGAALVHDLNRPIPAGWDQRYDTVVDGGTLEHVFNFPQALANCMRMVRTGGRLFIFTPANNQLGHGFYQFSPELFYRTLAPAHGFEIEKMRAVQFRYASTEHGSVGRPYRVADPAAVGSRITLVNSRPVTLMIEARKIAHRADPFATAPQQSDYTEIWRSGSVDAAPPLGAVARSLLRIPAGIVRRMLPPRLAERLRDEYDRRFVHSFRNKAFYTPDGQVRRLRQIDGGLPKVVLNACEKALEDS